MFLPTTIREVRERGWDALDVILFTGDAYVDHPVSYTHLTLPTILRV